MYIIDFFKSLFKKSKIGTIIWMVANTVMISLLFGTIFTDGTSAIGWQGCLIGLGIYFASILIALSPIGEWILRFMNGCKKITDPDILNRITPIFNEVHARAKQKTPDLDREINLYIVDDACPNAFACGRKTVAITKGLLSLSDAEIKGILGHEFGHLANKDTDTTLVIVVGNLIVSVIFFIIRVIFKIFSGILSFVVAIASESFIVGVLTAISNFIANTFLALLMALWTKLGVLICMASSRGDEYEADKYSHDIGYGNALAYALNRLDSMAGGEKAKGLWAALSSSHPETSKRVARLSQLG